MLSIALLVSMLATNATPVAAVHAPAKVDAITALVRCYTRPLDAGTVGSTVQVCEIAKPANR
jgi:hypothetical protein